MLTHATGQLFAIATAVLWATSATVFTAAGRRIGSVNVNLLRLSIAAALLAALCHLGGGALPKDAPPHVWKWLLLSGLFGFFICDLCLFQAYVLIGARRSMLMLSLAPVVAAGLDTFLIHKAAVAAARRRDDRDADWRPLGDFRTARR